MRMNCSLASAAMAFFVIMFKMFQLAQICEGVEVDDKASTNRGDNTSQNGDKMPTSDESNNYWSSILADDQCPQLYLDLNGQQQKVTEQTLNDDQFEILEWNLELECAMPMPIILMDQEDMVNERVTQSMMAQNQPGIMAQNKPAIMAQNPPEIMAQNQLEFMENNPTAMMAPNQAMMAQNQPGIMAQNQQIMVQNQPGIMAQNQLEFMANNPPAMMTQNQPEIMAQNQPGIMAQNQPMMAQNKLEMMAQNQPEIMAQNPPGIMAQNQPGIMAQNEPMMGQNQSMISQHQSGIMAQNQLMMAQNQPGIMAQNQPVIMAQNQPIMAQNELQQLIGGCYQYSDAAAMLNASWLPNSMAHCPHTVSMAPLPPQAEPYFYHYHGTMPRGPPQYYKTQPRMGKMAPRRSVARLSWHQGTPNGGQKIRGQYTTMKPSHPATVHPSAAAGTSLPTVMTQKNPANFDGIANGKTVAIGTNLKRPVEISDDGIDAAGAEQENVRELQRERRRQKVISGSDQQTTSKLAGGQTEDKNAKFIKCLWIITLRALEGNNFKNANDLLALLKSGAKMDNSKIKKHFEWVAKTLRQMDVPKVVERMEQMQQQQRDKSNNNFLMKSIGHIQTEATAIFGKSLIKVQKETKEHHMLIVMAIVGQKIEFDDPKIEDRANLLFFFLRLYRKMIGQIAAPYKGTDQGQEKHTEKSKRSEAEALLLLIGMTRNEVMAYFERYLDINASDQHKTILDLLASFDAVDLLSESIELAYFAIVHTIGPILIGQDIFKLRFPCLLKLLEDISAKNIACLLMINGTEMMGKSKAAGAADLMAQIAKSAENDTKRVSGTFLRIFDETIRRNGTNVNRGQSADNLIQIAEIYKQIYAKVGNNYLEANQKALIAKSETFQIGWDKFCTFLTKSAKQLGHLAKKWKETVKSADNGKEGDQSRQFSNDFVKKHCKAFTTNGRR